MASFEASGDGIRAVPRVRWVLSEHVDIGSISDVQAAAAGSGGFVCKAELFDSALFAISPTEGAAMDPQQRLLLELSYQAFHGHGLRRDSLLGTDTGVYVGMERPDWTRMQSPQAAASVYAVTADTNSVAAGRISFCLGLMGPCMSLDTACSSALSAQHSAASAMRNTECALALVASVTLKLSPLVTLRVAAAGMLSPDARCKTYDRSANGFVRAEGVGAIVLTRDAICEGAPARLLLGSAVRQDGRSASLTAPNGSAQRVLMNAALSRASVTAAAVASIEAHGTGTALGDPIESGALSHLFRAAPGHVAVGALKANVGHAEPMSGLFGICKALHVLSADCAGNAQLRVMNELVSEHLGGGAGPSAILPTQRLQRERGLVAVGGVSSFGYSGTIVHAVLSCSARAGEPARPTSSARRPGAG